MKAQDANFKKELKARDDKIDELEKLLFEKTAPIATSHPSSNTSTSAGESHIYSDRDGFVLIDGPHHSTPTSVGTYIGQNTAVDRRRHLDTLFIGSSIIRYVDIKPSMKVCLPGARAGQIWSHLVELNLSYTFDRVVIHVGANYLPRRPGKVWYDYIKGERTREYTRNELCDLLEAVTSLLPNSSVVYSSMLPTGVWDIAPSIATFNRWMKESCYELGVRFVEHRAFWSCYERGVPVICWDQIHPNYKGVAIFQTSLLNFLAR